MSLSNSKRIALNSISLYINMIVTMVATLLATRYVLQALGEEEYGIYMLLASIVALFSFLNITMAATIQRFLSYSLGAGDTERVREIFYMSVVTHLLLSVVVAVVISACGFYAIPHLLDIAPHYHSAARVVLCCLVGGILVTINSVPFEATMNAHEDISVIAFINIVEALLKLSAAVAVLLLGWGIEAFALLTLAAQGVAFLSKMLYSRGKYEETHFALHAIRDKALLKELFGFAGWNLIGASCGIIRYQGAAVLLNMFFGILINAAYGVAQQVNGFLLFFAGSIVRPFRPVVVKTEGSGNHTRMIDLSLLVSRITFLMLSLAVVPLFINMPYVLSVWLDEVPEGTLFFARMFLLIVLINQATIGLQLALESVGRIRLQQLIIGSAHIVAIPASLVLFVLGFTAETIMYCILVEEVICTFIRIWIAKRDAGVSYRDSYVRMLLPEVLTFSVSFIVVNLLISYLPTGFWGFLISGVLGGISIAIFGYILCFSSPERTQLKQTFNSLIINKLKR